MTMQKIMRVVVEVMISFGSFRSTSCIPTYMNITLVDLFIYFIYYLLSVTFTPGVLWPQLNAVYTPFVHSCYLPNICVHVFKTIQNAYSRGHPKTNKQNKTKVALTPNNQNHSEYNRFPYKPAELVHSFLFCSCVYFCLYGPFNFISFHEFFRQLSFFSLCSYGLIFALLVLSTTYLFMKVSFSPDIIICGWLGLKHRLITI